MKYRDAKNLHNGDQVIRKSDGAVLLVKEVEVYGQYKTVKLNCVLHIEGTGGAWLSLFHDEVK